MITTTPRYAKVDSEISAKASIQGFRKKYSATEKNVVSALVALANGHEEELQKLIIEIQEEAKAAKASKE